MPNSGSPDFGPALGCLSSPAIAELAAQLLEIPGLAASERERIVEAAEARLSKTLHAKLARLLVLELNIAQGQNRLSGDTPEERWRRFLELSAEPGFWKNLSPRYPTLYARTSQVIENGKAAVLSFAERWAADREALRALLGQSAGELTELSLGSGDTHSGGHTVAIVGCEGGKLVYKPRAVAVERALHRFVAELPELTGLALSIRTPSVLVSSPDHGWTEFIPHCHADSREELRLFYRGIGQWLALMRLLGGTDLHAENLIAHGPTPVVVDCETLFTPKMAPAATGFGDAIDRAGMMVSGTVLATGLLPSRGSGLGWRGVDISGVGALPGQQPQVMIPDIVDAGTDRARLGLKAVKVPTAQNHPAPSPTLVDFWPEVLSGFDSLTTELRRAANAGKLRSRLAPFEDCRIRVVVRATEAYSELLRMLWHPVSLHDEEKARRKATDLLLKMAENLSIAPSDGNIVRAEIDDLLVGDIPYFSTIARDGVLTGPGGTQWLKPANLVEQSWQNWRDADLSQERTYAQAALVSAYRMEGSTPQHIYSRPDTLRSGHMEKRRRAPAAYIAGKLVETVIRGRDGTVSWIGPSLSTAGQTVQPLGADLYGGLSGVALALGAYLRETEAGHADRVDGAEDLFQAVLHTLDVMEARQDENRRRGVPMRPEPVGAYLGLASRLWTRLVLHQWGLDPAGLRRAILLARQIPASVAGDDTLDVLSGRAGAIPALISLSKATGDSAFIASARALADDLCERASRDNGRAWWPTANWPEGMGGFAHGATGTGWALSHLGRLCRDERYLEMADAAFAFEASLFDEAEGNWTDLRGFEEMKCSAAWCHGSVGIGLAALDLDPRLANESTRITVRRAAEATWRSGIGWSHCLCHGDLGSWELLQRAAAAGLGPRELEDTDRLDAFMLTSIEDNGPVTGMLKDAFIPALLSGMGGILYQLLRMRPGCSLPSVLMMSMN